MFVLGLLCVCYFRVRERLYVFGRVQEKIDIYKYLKGGEKVRGVNVGYLLVKFGEQSLLILEESQGKIFKNYF